MCPSKKPIHCALTVTHTWIMVSYTGQLDVIISAASTEAMLTKLKWSGSELYRNANRTRWYAESQSDEVSGYVQSAGPLTYVVLRDAGHIVPYDQPVNALDMITRFVEDESFVEHPLT